MERWMVRRRAAWTKLKAERETFKKGGISKKCVAVILDRRDGQMRTADMSNDSPREWQRGDYEWECVRGVNDGTSWEINCMIRMQKEMVFWAELLLELRSFVGSDRRWWQREKPVEPSSLNNHDFQNQRTKPGCRSEGKANTKATSLMHPAKFFMAAAEYDPFG